MFDCTVECADVAVVVTMLGSSVVVLVITNVCVVDGWLVVNIVLAAN